MAIVRTASAFVCYLLALVVSGNINKEIEEYDGVFEVGEYTMAELEEICVQVGGFWLKNGYGCYEFEGVTQLDVVVDDCPGKCTNWSVCLYFNPERNCKSALGFKTVAEMEDKEDDFDYGFIIVFILGILVLFTALFCFGVYLAKA